MLKMNTRVQEKTHSQPSAAGKDKPLSLNLDRGNADDARNSAKLALRLVFLSHSSVATMTTAVRPCLVIFCGPSDFAFSINSLNFAFAPATVHASLLIA
jgi:hypothetical protein